MTEEKKKTAETAGVSSPAPSEPSEAGASPLPPLDFTTFILSLSSSVLISLGVLENPLTKTSKKDIAAAKQTIDLLVLLKEKTSGNLTEEESRLIGDILTELQLQYCSAAEG
jgi:hypothetical protein